jgi:uncharacterized protein YpiB (UPF0302 family)
LLQKPCIVNWAKKLSIEINIPGTNINNNYIKVLEKQKKTQLIKPKNTPGNIKYEKA